MKSCINIKPINAVPMTRKAYHQLRGWTIPLDENPHDQGFLIEYPETEPNTKAYANYVAWLPQAVFEIVYKAYDIPKQRVQVELGELTNRLEKLEAFLEKGKSESIDFHQWQKLKKQAIIMKDHQAILENRYDLMD